MRSLQISIAVTVLILSLLILPSVDAWQSGYIYRKALTLSGNGVAVSNYQVPLTIDTNSLISAGKLRSDCADIRFTDSSDTSTLSYWIESGCNSASTKIWVKVPSIPASGTTTIYLYYGNSGASSASNGPGTMELFDLWSGANCAASGTAGWSSSYMIINTVGGEGRCQYSFVPGDGFFVKFDFWSGGGSGADALWFFALDHGNTWHEDGTYNGYHYTFDEHGDVIGLTDCYGPSYDQCHNYGPSLASYSINSLDNTGWHGAEISNYLAKSKVVYYSTVGGSGTTVIDVTDPSPISRTGDWFGFGGRIGGLTNNHYARNFFVAKYADPAPTHTATGSEETPDLTPPTTSASHAPVIGGSGDSDWGHWHSNSQRVSLSCADNSGGSGCKYIHYKANGGATQSVAGTSTNVDFTTTGAHTLEYWSEDNQGNAETHTTRTVNVDLSNPSASISVNSGAAYTASTDVSLALTYSDGNSGVGSCRYSNDGSGWSDWEACTSPKSWSTTSGDGTKTVYYQVRDTVGNTAQATDSIIVDTIAPTGSISINGGAAYTNSVSVTLSLTYSDANGVDQCQYSNDNIAWSPWETCKATKSWGLTSGDGTKTVYYHVRDNPTNVNSFSDTIILDLSPPTTTINHDDTSSSHWHPDTQSVTLTCSPGTGSACSQTAYRTKRDSDPWSAWVVGTSFSLSVEGAWQIQYNSTDLSDNVEPTKTARINIDRSAPVTVANHNDPDTSHWHSSDQTVTFTSPGSVSDTYSGAAQTKYCTILENETLFDQFSGTTLNSEMWEIGKDPPNVIGDPSDLTYSVSGSKLYLDYTGNAASASIYAKSKVVRNVYPMIFETHIDIDNGASNQVGSFILSPQSVTTTDPTGNSDALIFQLDDNRVSIIKRQSGSATTLLNLPPRVPDARLKIALQDANTMTVWMDTGSGYSQIYTTTSLALTFSTAYVYLYHSEWGTSNAAFDYVDITCNPSTVYSMGIPVTGNGINIVRFFSSDNVGNVEQTSEAFVNLDKYPASFTYVRNPVNPDGLNGWYVSEPEVTITCIPGVSGCGTIYYCTSTSSLSCTQSPRSYTTSLTIPITHQGKTFINFSVSSGAGVRSVPYTDTVSYDSVPPTLTTSFNPNSPNGKNGWYNTSVSVTMTCSDSNSQCWWNEYCDDKYLPCTNNTVPTFTKTVTETNTHGLTLRAYDQAGLPSAAVTRTLPIDTIPPTITERYFHNGTEAAITGAFHGNITDRYWRLFLMAAFTDQATGSGFNTAGDAKMFFDNGAFFRQLFLTQQNGNINYSSFIVQGNTSYGLYVANFSVEDVAGWKTEVPALNNKLNITKIEIEGNETAAAIAGSVMTMDPGDSIIETGNEKVFFVTLNNYLNQVNPVRLTITTAPTGVPVSNWAMFTKYRRSPENRTLLDIDLGIQDTVTVPVTAIGGMSGVDYTLKVTANFTQEAVIYERSALIQVRDPSRGFFTTSPEPTTLFAIIASFVVLFLVLSSHKLSDIFK